MPEIYICFVWHMHQPFYKDLWTGEYHLPWTRLHALKDYHGMVKMLEEFPGIHQTFNLVPSMLVQISEYARGEAADPFLRCALKPAEELTTDERAFILRYFFQASVDRMIRRYPRYGELYDAWRAADENPQRALHFFSHRTLRDLQVLSQLAWFGEEFLDKDPEVRELAAKGRDYDLDDQRRMGSKQREILGRVLPAYREFAGRGRIEISTTPFYHPILPLLCDSNIASVAHPGVPLPPPFCYSGDARHQLQTAREYMQAALGLTPRGLWPSEGSVSDEALALAAEIGFAWTATDNGVLARTLHRAADGDLTYRPYLWRQNGREIRVIFRDHYLSDLIGFVYSRLDCREAAGHFLERICENCRHFTSRGQPALVPVILDGENAWEHYERNGRPFLRELYRLIEADPRLHALTVSDALERMEPAPLEHIFPGSWINANFDVWIGAPEDNRAWELLLHARQTYERVAGGAEGAAISEEQKRVAYEELLIAEGSDWNWWYGPEHSSPNRPEFDQLYRSHLANVYRALGLTPPDELSRPILKPVAAGYHQPATAYIQPAIDGEVTSYFEWMGAAVYRADQRSGAMHGGQVVVEELRYGSDGQNLYLRLDFQDREAAPGLILRLSARAAGKRTERKYTIEIRPEGPAAVDGVFPGELAFKRIFEVKLPLAAVRVGAVEAVRVQLSLWRGSLPLEAVPSQGWLSVPTADPAEWPV